MTYVPCKLWMPFPSSALSITADTIDATGEKATIIGQVSFPPGTSGPKDIRKLQFRFSGVTKAGGSGLTASVQALSTSAGPQAQPDGTPLATVAIANGNAAFASNSWLTTGNLSVER